MITLDSTLDISFAFVLHSSSSVWSKACKPGRGISERNAKRSAAVFLCTRLSASSRSSPAVAGTAATETITYRTSDAEYPSVERSSAVVSLYRNVHKYNTAHEAINALITGQMNRSPDSKEMALRKSLQERRKIVRDLLVEFFRLNKMGPTFSSNVASNMAEFIDHVMIEAAALKKNPQHANAPFSFRARVYIEQTGVSQIVKSMKHHRFTAPRIGKLVYMVEDYAGNLQPKIKWLKHNNVKGRDLGVSLTREPRILEKSLNALDKSVALLREHGVRNEWTGWVVRRSPKVLACSEEELLERIMFYRRLGIGAGDFGKMVYRFPACLGHFALADMNNKVEYLKGLGLDDTTLGVILVKKPQLIACSIEDDWKPLIKLLYYLGIDGNGVVKILTWRPSIFCLSMAENITPKIRFLRDIGIQEELLGDVLVRFPPVLSYGLEKKIQPVVRFLLEEAGVPADKLGKVVAAQPDLFSCSLPNKLAMVARFFRYHGIPKERIGQMVVDFPMVLKYSLQIIKPKFKYFIENMARPVDEIIRFPRFFSYALETRITIRHKILVEIGCHMELQTMLACSDEEFASRIEDVGV